MNGPLLPNNTETRLTGGLGSIEYNGQFQITGFSRFGSVGSRFINNCLASEYFISFHYILFSTQRENHVKNKSTYFKYNRFTYKNKNILKSTAHNEM